MAEKFGDLANVAAGALVFGQALSGGQVSARTAIVGGFVWLATTAIGFVLAASEDE